MYIKYGNYKGNLQAGDTVLMSAVEFAAGGKNLTGVPVTITPDGKEPAEVAEVPEDTMPKVVEEPTAVLEPTIEQRQDQVEAALIEIAAMLGG